MDLTPLSGLITPKSKSTSTCFRISFCFSSECLRGGARLHGRHYLSSSITIFICSNETHQWIQEPKLWVVSEVVEILRRLSETLIVEGSRLPRQLSPHRKNYTFNQCHHNPLSDQKCPLLNEFILSEHPVWEGVLTLWSVGTSCHRTQGIVITLGYKEWTIATRQCPCA